MSGGGLARRAGLQAVRLGLLLAALLVLYAPALRGEFISDDRNVILRNRLLTDPEGWRLVWTAPEVNVYEEHYWPMAYTLLWALRQWAGSDPLPYHATNVVLHALNAFLVWTLLRREGVPWAWGGAFLFAFHPVQVESVAWVCQSRTLGAVLFALLAFLVFQRGEGGRVWRGAVRPLLCAAFAAVSLLFKSVTAPLPLLLLLFAWWRRGRMSGGDWLAAGAAGLAVGAVVLFDLRYVRAHGTPGFDLSPGEHIGLMGTVFWAYAGKLIFPFRLGFFYPKWEPVPLVGGAGLLALAVALVLAWRRARRGGARAAAAALAAYCLCLLPVLGLVEFRFLEKSWMADRYQYLASIAPLALAASALGRAGEMMGRRVGSRLPGSADPRAPGAALILAVLGILAVLTFRQAGVWRTEESFWCHAVRISPDSSPAVLALGLILEDRGREPEALNLYDGFLVRHPADAEALATRGALLHRLGRGAQARTDYEASLRLRPDDPRTRHNLGLLLLENGEAAAAVVQFEEAVRLLPAYGRARENLERARAALRH